MFNVFSGTYELWTVIPGKETMENSKLQSTFTLINSIKFEEKIDIDDLVLPPKQTGNSDIDTSNIKQEPVENFRSEMEKEITLLFEELDN